MILVEQIIECNERANIVSYFADLKLTFKPDTRVVLEGAMRRKGSGNVRWENLYILSATKFDSCSYCPLHCRQ